MRGRWEILSKKIHENNEKKKEKKEGKKKKAERKEDNCMQNINAPFGPSSSSSIAFSIVMSSRTSVV